MKKTIAILSLAFAATWAQAGQMASNVVTGEIRRWPPIDTIVASAPESAYQKENWVKLDPKAQEAYDAAEKAKAEAAAIASAQAQAEREAALAQEAAVVQSVLDSKSDKEWRENINKLIESWSKKMGEMP